MSSLVPVLVRTFGRTGSTLLMQILATDKCIFFERKYPFEHRYLTYIYNMAQVVQKPMCSDVDWSNDILFEGRKTYVGGLPYNKVECFDPLDFSQKAFVGLWEKMSMAMREKQGFAAEQSCFYAEKVPHEIADYAGEHIGAKCIYLLRDPRDEMVSIKSFNAKRGFHSFGYLESDTDLSYAVKMCKRRKPFMQAMLDKSASDKDFYLRYEDLVDIGEQEVKRLSDWLGVSLNIESASNNAEIQNLHMTSKNFKSSVERWRSELPGEVLDFFKQELGQELTGLGYAI